MNEVIFVDGEMNEEIPKVKSAVRASEMVSHFNGYMELYRVGMVENDDPIAWSKLGRINDILLAEGQVTVGI